MIRSIHVLKPGQQHIPNTVWGKLSTYQPSFTKGSTFYPGPGIWPSDGRGFTFTVGIKI